MIPSLLKHNTQRMEQAYFLHSPEAWDKQKIGTWNNHKNTLDANQSFKLGTWDNHKTTLNANQ